jgi:homocysteine S-methyltransferase
MPSGIDISSLRVLDGGLASELERRGCDISGSLWSAHVLDTSPEAIRDVHLDYLRAGADCISTVGYQVSAMGYAGLGRPAADAAHALRLSVEIAEQARAIYSRESSRRVFVAASLGPYGAALHNGAEFHGRYTISFDELVQFHAERLAVIAATPADLVALETIPSHEEACAIAEALRPFPQLSVWLSFTCHDHSSVVHGEPLAQCAAVVDILPQAVAVGVNCTHPRFIPALIAQARSATVKPVFVYPNSGEVWDVNHRSWHGTASTQTYSRQARQWFEAGAHAVGGCCRTTPAHIRAVRTALGRSAGDLETLPAL